MVLILIAGHNRLAVKIRMRLCSLVLEAMRIESNGWKQ